MARLRGAWLLALFLAAPMVDAILQPRERNAFVHALEDEAELRAPGRAEVAALVEDSMSPRGDAPVAR